MYKAIKASHIHARREVVGLPSLCPGLVASGYLNFLQRGCTSQQIKIASTGGPEMQLLAKTGEQVKSLKTTMSRMNGCCLKREAVIKVQSVQSQAAVALAAAQGQRERCRDISILCCPRSENLWQLH